MELPGNPPADPIAARGHPTGTVSEEAAPPCSGPGQQTPTGLETGEWRKTPAGTSPGAKRDQRSTSRRRLREATGTGGNLVSPNSFGKEPRSSAWTPTPRSPDSRSTAGRARRETKFPGQWKTIEKAQQEGRWSCRCSTELPLHRGKKISAQSTRWGLIHPGGPATTNPIPGLSSWR